MEKREPTIRARELGESMRLAMVMANLNGVRACAELGWSKSKLSRMFLGTRGVSHADLVDFLRVCGVTGAERDRMLAICAELRAPAWSREQAGRLPRHLHALIDHEEQAVTIRGLDLLVVPAPLQTDDYARALVAADVTVPPNERDARVVAKLTRRQFIKRDLPPTCVFHIAEAALRLPVGGHDLRADQARDLVRMSERRNITIRVVPTERGVTASAAGSFRLLEFADFKPVVCVESETSCQFIEGTDEVTGYRAVLAALAETALTPDESRAFLVALAEGRAG
ncbi:helix-turn-helix domain-containing protein [Actinokineospora globicatena]|uniref:helix-turn-helix domain-containing protein n=1 Tax=Actinokineospora globicatena TaxID=103729 RepID=UPI0020A26F3B|nr:helix-turn-helix transcriptional regulator [Actinokineospora globicatena]MCP2301490.1 Helix-turn-helix domain-containing protein [Actinokineospora globicatena]GLW76863.1 transcriptional regulator [Actinokineospora globicatena]GLW83696.1 transcriptional regulator [Actinokineospora globicatena]